MFGITSLIVLASTLMAFVFSRLVFPGRELLFNFFTLGLLFPKTVAFLPVYIEVRNLSLINNLWGIILPLVAFAIPDSTLILRGFFRSIPPDLEDASYIDGCGTLGFFWYILLPLARPALGTCWCCKRLSPGTNISCRSSSSTTTKSGRSPSAFSSSRANLERIGAV